MNVHPNKNRDTKLVSYNCKNVIRSAECVRDLCRSADIIALQETWLYAHNIPFLATIDPEFEFFGKSSMDTSAGLLRGRPYGGVALLWRKSVFKNVSVVQCNSARIAAIKIVLSQRTLLVFSLHMPNDKDINLSEFTECLSEVAAIVEDCGVDSVCILGDFNAKPGALFGKELHDFCVEQDWRCADIELLGLESDSYTFVSDVHGTTSWLDHCIVSEAAWRSVLDAKIHYDVNWSDHFPIEITCNLDILRTKYTGSVTERSTVIWGDRNAEQIENYKKYCNDKLRDINFPSEFQNCDRRCTVVEHRTIIDEMYANIVNILSTGASHTFGRVTPIRKKQVIGWNKHVKQAHAEARLGFQNWVLFGKPKTGYLYDMMKTTRKTFKQKLKWCQEHSEQIKMDILASHHTDKQFGKFWKQTSKLSPRVGLPASVEGVSEAAKIAGLFKDHFRVQSPFVTPQDALPRAVGSPGGLHVFTAEEVLTVLKGMRGGKSPGHDSISIEHLRFAGVHLPGVLAMLFSLCVVHAYLPDDMMKTVVVPLVKNRTGDVSDIGNYRPISLATTIAKVLDCMLDKQLQKHLVLHDAQFGFRSGLSTETAVLCLKHTVRYYTDRKTPVYACFLDLSKAFDLVSYSVLWKKLSEDTTMPDELIELFKYWYGHQSNVVRWAGSLSEPYRLECGVRQGGLSSPRLFCLYVNRLIGELSGAMVGCSVGGKMVNNISYADDMALLSPSISALRKLVGICERYAVTHGLRYNSTKSELLIFKAGNKFYPHVPPVSLDGTILKQVSHFKYLGHWVTDTLKDDMDVERERRALAVRSNMLIRRFAKCSEKVKITLFRAFCQSFYTCSLWINVTQAAYSALRVLYNNAFRMLLGLPRYCSASGMFAEARVDDFHAIMRKRVASLMRRVRASPNSLLATVAERVDGPILRHWTNTHVLPCNALRCAK